MLDNLYQPLLFLLHQLQTRQKTMFTVSFHNQNRFTGVTSMGASAMRETVRMNERDMSEHADERSMSSLRENDFGIG